MGIRSIFLIRQFHCCVIFSAFAAVFSYSAFAYQSIQDEPARKPLLVDISWLQERMDAPGIVVLDARLPGQYEQGHIAGAINLPSGDTFHTRFGRRVTSLAKIQFLLGGRGIHPDDYVIIYGCDNYRDAARVFWVLELYGHTNVALLNGGYPAWKNAGLPTDTLAPVRKNVIYRAALRSGFLSTRLQVLLAMDNPSIAIVDTRDAVEYEGFDSEADRSGHIPTAINIPAELNLEELQGVSFFKSTPALEELYKDLADHSKVILYCNNGCESSTSFMVLRLLGKDVSIYEGGWREWGNDPLLPVDDSLQ